MVTKGYIMEFSICIELSILIRDVPSWRDILIYLVITIGGVIYLKDRSPYLDSSFLSSESQNIIEVNLLETYSTVNTYFKIYLSTLLSLIYIPRSISHKYL